VLGKKEEGHFKWWELIILANVEEKNAINPPRKPMVTLVELVPDDAPSKKKVAWKAISTEVQQPAKK